MLLAVTLQHNLFPVTFDYVAGSCHRYNGRMMYEYMTDAAMQQRSRRRQCRGWFFAGGGTYTAVFSAVELDNSTHLMQVHRCNTAGKCAERCV
jgi:hypothetical protein